jgi:hypothetical protein
MLSRKQIFIKIALTVTEPIFAKSRLLDSLQKKILIHIFENPTDRLVFGVRLQMDKHRQALQLSPHNTFLLLIERLCPYPHVKFIVATKKSHKFGCRVHVAPGCKVWPGCVLVFMWKSSACIRCQQQQTHGHDAACHLVSSETLWPHYFIPHSCMLSGHCAVLAINGTIASFSCTSQTIQNYEIGGSFSY